MPPNQSERYMRLALSLAARGLGNVWPNPAVGCVIVKDDHIIGRGWTQDGGRPHAETMALTQAGSATKGATAFVTLEPCSHHGKTPPCAEALISSGISTVYSALTDPDQRVSGKGHEMLRAAGITVHEGLLKSEATAANQGFLNRVTLNRPLVTLKLATSLDGRIATKSGDSRWITNSQSRAIVHNLRASHDAVLIGSGTALADDPDLRVRKIGLDHRNPVRVIIDSRLQSDPNGRLAQSADETPHWILHGPDAQINLWDEKPTRLFACPTVPDGLDLSAALSLLADQGITRILCEGGGGLAASLLKLGLVDRLITFTAGVAIGADGLPSLKPMGIDPLNSAPRFQRQRTLEIGGDIMSEWTPV